MRRHDREVTNIHQIGKILGNSDVLRIALCENNQPYIIPVNFGIEWVDNNINLYFHSAKQGKKIDIIKQNNRVCFEVDKCHKIIQHDVACSWSADYESVIGNGIIQEMKSIEDKKYGLDFIMQHYGYDVYNKELEYNNNILNKVCVFKILVEDITGKQKLS